MIRFSRACVEWDEKRHSSTIHEPSSVWLLSLRSQTLSPLCLIKFFLSGRNHTNTDENDIESSNRREENIYNEMI